MLKKILLGLLLVIVVAVVGFLAFVMLSWNKKYDIPYPDLHVSTDSAVIARGQYLVNGPAHCISCHVSGVDDLIKSDKGEPVALKGGVRFPMGPLGAIYPRNLTPDKTTGLGQYEDGQIFRMMRHAVKPNGTATLSLMMPFWNMADDDLVAIVSYLKSLGPVQNTVPEPEWTFMGKVIRSISPTFKPILNPEAPAQAPPMAPTVERGEYLARFVCNCVGCHTERDLMTYEAIGPEFAGGMEFEPFVELHKALNIDTTLWTRTTNITPHPNSTLSRFKTKEEWIARFRQGRILPHSPMDWGPFSRMSDEDLEALYIYLNSLEPVDKEIAEVNFKKEKK
ncbi:MAG TPA: cytochrome c [Saprospiraceae bacterium]|nr:cytochrome c [Saprospiraceae bacterium]